MAQNYHREPLLVVHSGELTLNGWFYPDGTTDPSNFDKAWIKSVSHDSTGNWTVTLLDRMPQFFRELAYHVSGRDNAVVDCFVRPGVVDLAAKTFKVEAVAAGSAANIAANANSRISLSITVKINKVNDGSELV